MAKRIRDKSWKYKLYKTSMKIQKDRIIATTSLYPASDKMPKFDYNKKFPYDIIVEEAIKKQKLEEKKRRQRERNRFYRKKKKIEEQEIKRGKDLEDLLIAQTQILLLNKEEVERDPYSIKKRKEFNKIYEKFTYNAIVYGGKNSEINPFLEFSETVREEYLSIIKGIDLPSGLESPAKFYRWVANSPDIGISLILSDLNKKKIEIIPKSPPEKLQILNEGINHFASTLQSKQTQ